MIKNRLRIEKTLRLMRTTPRDEDAGPDILTTEDDDELLTETDAQLETEVA